MSLSTNRPITTVSALLAVQDFSEKPLAEVLTQKWNDLIIKKPLQTRINNGRKTSEGVQAQRGLEHIKGLIAKGQELREIIDSCTSALDSMMCNVKISVKNPVHTTFGQVLLDLQPIKTLSNPNVDHKSSDLEYIKLLMAYINPGCLTYSSSKIHEITLGSLSYAKMLPKDAKHLLGWIKWCTECGIRDAQTIWSMPGFLQKPSNMQDPNAALNTFNFLKKMELPIKNITPRNAKGNFYVQFVIEKTPEQGMKRGRHCKEQPTS